MKDQPQMFDQYLTQLDLEMHPFWNTAWKGQNQDAFERILYDFGCDPEYGYSIEMGLARARRKDLKPYQQVEYGVVVRFKERTDPDWAEFRAIEDIVRDNVGGLTAALARVGMIESLGSSANPLNEAIENDDGISLNTLAGKVIKEGIKE